MTNYRNLKNMNIDELAKWLDEYGQFDNSPWAEWFDTIYCKKCDPITCKVKGTNIGIAPLFPEQEIDVSYCELYNKCKFFKQLDDILTNKDIIKMWLKSKVENEKADEMV